MAVSMSQMSTDGSVSIYMEPLRCADGELYLTAAPNWAWLEGLVRIAALVLAAAVFCAVVVPYILHLLRRIEALSRETGALMAGDLSHSIRAPGRDELSRLGADIERLRLSVLERLEGEREAVGATGRLITGLSHDLRTPLTKLMGYLEILRRCQSGEEREKYLRLAAEKAEQIKGMTDQLFDRAQVPDSREALAREPELVDGAQLLGQILSEVCGDLQREGFQAPQPVFTEPFRLYLRPEDAVRVFDNLFSNLCKYGDPGLGELVRQGKYSAEKRFCDELVERGAEVVQALAKEKGITHITCVPSLRSDLVPDYARRLAKACGLPFVELLHKSSADQQKTMENSSHQCANAFQSFSVLNGVQTLPRKVLLVDDMVDSKWTLTVCGCRLMEKGCQEVYPFALADSSQKEED